MRSGSASSRSARRVTPVAASCFYRKVEAEDGGARLVFVDADRLFDPDAVYKK